MQLKEVQLPSFFRILRSELNKTDRWLDGWDIATFVEFKKCPAIIGRFILGVHVKSSENDAYFIMEYTG